MIPATITIVHIGIGAIVKLLSKRKPVRSSENFYVNTKANILNGAPQEFVLGPLLCNTYLLNVQLQNLLRFLSMVIQNYLRSSINQS